MGLRSTSTNYHHLGISWKQFMCLPPFLLADISTFHLFVCELAVVLKDLTNRANQTDKIITTQFSVLFALGNNIYSAAG